MPESTPKSLRPKVERYVAPSESTEVGKVDSVDVDAVPTGFYRHAWNQVRTRPTFIIAAALIAFILVVVIFPGLFTSKDPRFGSLDQANLSPSGDHWFGTDQQGYDVYARTVYGARASVVVGILTTAIVFVVGGLLGAIAGFFGSWLDSFISRISDVFFGIPLVLAAVVTMQVITDRTIYTVVVVLAVFGWPQVARIARSAAIAIRNDEFITASRALGASKVRTLFTHVVPNALGPVVVVCTILLGVVIVTEATLSYLGLGLPSTEVSWGGDISRGQQQLRQGSATLFFPATALALTVLAFMMLGDVLRDALDPKARAR